MEHQPVPSVGKRAGDFVYGGFGTDGGAEVRFWKESGSVSGSFLLHKQRNEGKILYINKRA